MGELVLEEGYTVSTVIDGNKLKINPHSILPVSGSSDFIVLDSSSSSFYSLSLPMSQGSVIKPFSGNGTSGFSDGVLGSSMFNKPRSFAVDVKGNVYVADKNNHAIRKISSSGVSTIAGGYSQKAGFADGPAQHALFSDDFELAFVPEKCALLISDHGSKLIRQINLRHEDCVRGSHSVLGATALWTLGLGLSCLLGLIIGFVVRPYVAPREMFQSLTLTQTWKHCLIHLAKQAVMFCFDIRSVIVKSAPYAFLWKLILLTLSHLDLMYRFSFVNRRVSSVTSVNLLDSDALVSSDIQQPNEFADQLKDLITFDEPEEPIETTNKNSDPSELTSESHGSIDRMIEANFSRFVVSGSERALFGGHSGLVKRR